MQLTAYLPVAGAGPPDLPDHDAGALGRPAHPQRHTPAAPRHLVLPPVHPSRSTRARHPLKGQARVAALRELRSLASTHQSVTKAIAEAGGVSLLTSLLGPFTSHSMGSEAVAILVSGVPLDAEAKAALMQPAKVSLVVDMLNEGAVDTKINCVRLIRIVMEEKGCRPETVASLSLSAGRSWSRMMVCCC
uniref:U-box domain-containing protein n=1 Tax=Aegilops tauschii subsp. strangulata TaxID=200361 RepID=A0A453FXL2_AEGTS